MHPLGYAVRPDDIRCPSNELYFFIGSAKEGGIEDNPWRPLQKVYELEFALWCSLLLKVCERAGVAFCRHLPAVYTRLSDERCSVPHHSPHDIVSQCVNGPVWKGESDRLSEPELDTYRRAMRWQTDQQLRKAYEIYRGALALDAEEWPPNAARVQYFVTAWRELRRRKNRKNASEKIAPPASA